MKELTNMEKNGSSTVINDMASAGTFLVPVPSALLE
jgi:hypothetical protein